MATQMGWAFLFAPTGAFTLEANVLFESYALALAYAKTDATALVGKVISVVNDGVYTIEAVGENAVLKKVGADIDLSNYVTKDQISSIFTYKGSVDRYTDLPADAVKGDVWNIKEAFELEDELGGKLNFPAGTNVAYDGTLWDTLAGEIDLSAYAKTSDLEDAKTNLTTAIGGVAADLALTNAEVAKKVNAEDGKSLVANEKIALIDTNAGAISALQEADTSLDARLKVVEGAFKGEGGEIDLGDLTTQITDHGTRLVTLESDNTTNKNNITTLQGEVSGHSGRLTAIENVNTELAGQISGLTTRIEAVEKHGEAISTLTGLVNGHTESISTLNTGVSEAKALATSEAGKALTDAKAYADSLAKDYDEAGAAEAVLGNLNTHIADTTLHVTQAEREAWNEAKEAIDAFLKDAEFDAEGKSVVDTLKELQTYMSSDGEAATLLVNRVAALEAIDHDAYKNADTALETSLQSYVDGKIELLGTAAYEAKEAFATAAQGALAETAAQKADTYTKTEVNNLLEDAFAWIVVNN